MATAWQSLEEAALTLGISSRTLHRRLARGELQSRMDAGRREVLVVITNPQPAPEMMAAAQVADTPDDMTDTSATSSDHASYAADDYGSAIDSVSEEVQQTMLALHEDRLRRTDLAIMAYQQSVNVTAADARRAVARSRIAWGVAGGLTVMAFLAGTWATHSVTKAKAEVSHLSANVRQLSEAVDTKSRETKELQQESQVAKVAAARAEGELAAAKRQVEQLVAANQAAEARLSAHRVMADTSATATTQPTSGVAPATQPSVRSQPTTTTAQ